MGFLSLTENSRGNIHLEGTVIGLSPGLHCFHIHESSNRNDGCTSFGPHFNPRNKDHGMPEGEKRHLGDFGNIIANQDGVASLSLDLKASLNGPESILDRGFVFHEKEDDLGIGNSPLSL